MANLITAQEVINNSPVSGNFAPQHLEKHIKHAQFRHLKPFLTPEFFDALVADKEEDGTFATEAYQTFWDEHLKELAAFAVLFQALPFIATQINTQGAIINVPQGTQAADSQSVRYLTQTLGNQLEERKRLATEWLTDADSGRNLIYTLFGGNSCTVKDGALNPLGILGLKRTTYERKPWENCG